MSLSQTLTALTLDDDNSGKQKAAKSDDLANPCDDVSADQVEDQMARGPYNCKECSTPGNPVPLKGHKCPFKRKVFYVTKKKNISKCDRYSQTNGESAATMMFTSWRHSTKKYSRVLQHANAVDSFLYMKETGKALPGVESKNDIKQGKVDILPIWIQAGES